MCEMKKKLDVEQNKSDEIVSFVAFRDFESGRQTRAIFIPISCQNKQN